MSDTADADVPAGATPRRSRTVLYTSVGVAIVIAVLVGVMASAQPASKGTTSDTLIGKAAPTIDGPALTGSSTYTLAQFSGKWVVVNFAASWCVPCKQETPQLLDFAAEHSRSGDAVVLAVAFDKLDVSSLAAFLRTSGATWPAVNDPSAEVAYGVSQIPQSFLVSPRGLVAAKFFGAVKSAEIDEVIAEDSGLP